MNWKIFPILAMTFFLVACSHKPIGKDIHNKKITTADCEGKWVVINYWATWCAPCHEEIPELNKFYQAHKNQVAVFGVNYDNLPASKQKIFAKKYAIEYPLLQTDLGEFFNLPPVPALPATYVISPDRHLKERLLGSQTKEDLEIAMGFTMDKKEP